MELLRIVAILLVMFGHFHLRIHHLPNSNAIIQYPLTSFLEVLTACVSTMGVGIFIAISGWFGIHFKLSGLAKYLFQVFFILWSIYILFVWFGLAKLDSAGIKTSLTLFEGYWFVAGYLGLYLISPILNVFIEHASKRDFQTVLISCYLFQIFYSWLTAWYDYYMAYSIFLFAGIYLTTAYLRKYPIASLEKYALSLLTFTVLIITIVAVLSMLYLGHAGRMIRDDNPLVIFACILLVMVFSKIRLQNRIINRLATSCFAVYLIHFHPLVYPHLMVIICDIHEKYDGIVYGVLLMTCLLLVYLICSLVDHIRMIAWSIIYKKS